MTFGLMLDSRGVKCQAAHDGIIIAPPRPSNYDWPQSGEPAKMTGKGQEA
jgi:hypothetical protein